MSYSHMILELMSHDMELMSHDSMYQTFQYGSHMKETHCTITELRHQEAFPSFASISAILARYIVSCKSSIIKIRPQHDKTNKMTSAQQRLRSAWASSQSDQSFRLASMGSQVPKASSCGQPRLRWAHWSFCWFCHAAAHLIKKFGHLKYHKNPSNLDTRKICCNHPKI